MSISAELPNSFEATRADRLDRRDSVHLGMVFQPGFHGIQVPSGGNPPAGIQGDATTAIYNYQSRRISAVRAFDFLAGPIDQANERKSE
jgi:hypothetical protein